MIPLRVPTLLLAALAFACATTPPSPGVEALLERKVQTAQNLVRKAEQHADLVATLAEAGRAARPEASRARARLLEARLLAARCEADLAAARGDTARDDRVLALERAAAIARNLVRVLEDRASLLAAEPWAAESYAADRDLAGARLTQLDLARELVAARGR